MSDQAELKVDAEGTIEVDELEDDDFIVVATTECSLVIAKPQFFDSFQIPADWQLGAVSGENVEELVAYELPRMETGEVVELLEGLLGDGTITVDNVPVVSVEPKYMM